MEKEPLSRIRFRNNSGQEHTVPLRDFSPIRAAPDLLPWRRFHSHKGQLHLSGTYWSSTMQGHVIHESRLELSRLMLADFDPSVVQIQAQPFELQTRVCGKPRRHIPDYLLIHKDDSVTVVDVKPAARLLNPIIREKLTWPGPEFRSQGWAHEIWSSEEATRLENVRFLAGFRRGWLFEEAILEAVGKIAAGKSIADVESTLSSSWPIRFVRPVIFHLLWTSQLRADLTQPLAASTELVA